MEAVTHMASDPYAQLLERKTHLGFMSGFEPTFLPDWLFDFQKYLVDASVRKGRMAVLADCGMGKCPMALVWAQNVIEHTNKPVLVLTPLSVGAQMLSESLKFNIHAERSRQGGRFTAAHVVIANYEQLDKFDSSDFAGVVCDESSILKHFTGATQQSVTRFMTKVPYRLLCTATAAPNDYTELGTSSEALGELGMRDMLSRFFKQEQKVHQLSQREAVKKGGQRLSVIAGTGAAWRLKGHAVTPFWKWVASWAKACRKPSDLGFNDGKFILPDLIEREHIIEPVRPKDGMLFTIPAVGLQEEREERRRTIVERCELAAQLVDHEKPAVVWCHMNDEGDMLQRLIPGSVQVKGANTDDQKEDAYARFAYGDIRVLVIKPKIGAWGLNWQHCAHVVTFASHSYEQYYQSVRRCWRFGQESPVVVDVIATEGERNVRESMVRKGIQADQMFRELIEHMYSAERMERTRTDVHQTEVPSWL